MLDQKSGGDPNYGLDVSTYSKAVLESSFLNRLSFGEGFTI